MDGLEACPANEMAILRLVKGFTAKLQGSETDEKIAGHYSFMINRFIPLAAMSLALSVSRSIAVESASAPDFKEVQQIVREHLAGATDDSMNRAAVDGLLLALKGRATVITNASEPSTNPVVSHERVFDGGIGYVRLARIESPLAESLNAAVKELSLSNKLNGLILDMRFAEGENYAAGADAVDLFLKSEMPLLNAGKGLVSSKEKTNAFTLPVVGLVNGETGGAAEAVAATLRQSGAGLLIGSRTSGRAGVKNDFKLSNGQTLRVVVAPVQLGNAKAIPSTGVVPDIEVLVKLDDERAFHADPFANSAAAQTNSTATTRARRVRPSESDLVRQKRGEGDVESLMTARAIAEPETLLVQDPALSRAIDLLKGLAVVRQGKF